MTKSSLVLLICLGCWINLFKCYDGLFSEDRLRALAEKLGSRLHRIVKDATGYEDIEKGFTDLRIKYDEVNPSKPVQDVAENLAKAIQKKIVAVERLVEIAEEAARGYKWNDRINISYHNAKEPDSNATGFEPIDLTRDSRFYGDAVNLHYSTVHVPTNVFHRSKIIQNGVQWSKKLDKSFQDIFDKDPTMKSQTFCSSSGFSRMFPGIRWPHYRELSREAEKPELYDCRLTSWFIRASSSPKDMVILLDISGSMTGLRRETAKRTVIEIMNTLNEDDFFNVLTFKDEVTYLDPWLNDTLVQASDSLKRRFFNLLQKIPTADFANYTVALPVAFELLARKDSNHTTSCNKAIMIISDTAPELFEDIIGFYNPEQNVRLFSYVIGREVTEYEYMARIACQNRGFVGHIVTLADIRDYVEEYYQVLGRPMVLMKNHTNIWTGAYFHPHNVLGMVTTMAQPVFNRSAEMGMKGSLIGVIGIDMLVEDFLKPMTLHKWGVGSYAFGINHNGRLLFHPGWKMEPFSSGNGLMKPIHSEVDLSDVERQNQSQLESKLRTDMIDQVNGSYKMKVLRLLDGNKRVYEREYQYYYHGIADSPFSIALAIPTGLENSFSQKIQIHGIRRPREVDGDLFAATKWSLHPDWYYCNITASRSPNITDILRDIFMSGQSDVDLPSLTCDRELIESVIFDAKATQSVGSHWFGNNKSDQHGDLSALYGVSTCFLSTRSGLTRWRDKMQANYPTIYSHIDCVPTPPDLTYTDDFDNVTCTTGKHFFEFYSRAVDESFYERTTSSGSAITITVGIRNALYEKAAVLSSDFLMASLPVFVTDEKRRTVPVAVTGVIMSSNSLRDLLRQISRETCKGVENCISCHSSSINCYLLDESGYVVADTLYAENTGKFFGVLQGDIMNSLVERRIYKTYEIKDVQGVCTPPVKSKSNSGASVKFWITVLANAFRNLLARFLIQPLIQTYNLAFASDEYYHFESREENVTVTQAPQHYLCDSHYRLFNKIWDGSTFMYQLKCASNCTNPRSCLCNDIRLSTEPIEVKYTAEEIHQKHSVLRHRKTPSDCFSYYKDEDYSYCLKPTDPYMESMNTPSSSTKPKPFHVLLFMVPFVIKL